MRGKQKNKGGGGGGGGGGAVNPPWGPGQCLGECVGDNPQNNFAFFCKKHDR